ncbi:MAG: hypothetical protein WAL36_17060, partial [Pseudolabrys sp.]
MEKPEGSGQRCREAGLGPAGCIDFATKLNGNDDPSQPSEFKLLVKNAELSKALLETKILRFNGGSP